MVMLTMLGRAMLTLMLTKLRGPNGHADHVGESHADPLGGAMLTQKNMASTM